MSATALSPLDSDVIGRTTSLFGDDLVAAGGELSNRIGGSRALIIGGAGSIGFQTLRTITRFEPAHIHVIDHNENGLAELVRMLRAAERPASLHELLALPFDYGGDPFRLWLAASKVHYDHVFNFAALKHVRSEKDPFSILSMLETNVVHLDSLSRLLAQHGRPHRVFSVSTDKAANPTSMMGATKRLMEHALFLPTQSWGAETEIASARFANVAFSNGSLLQSWQLRMHAGQPLACPEETRRFFVSLEESGQLCTLVGVLGADRTVSVPALDPAANLVLLTDVVERFLRHHGYRPCFTRDPDEAVGRVAQLRPQGHWPVLLTPLDTAGEKPIEEFAGEDETVRDSRFGSLREIEYLPPADPGSFAVLIDTLRDILSGADQGPVTADRLKELIARVEPSFGASHHASAKSLDDRI